MSPRQSSGASAAQPSVTIAVFGLVIVTGLAGRSSPIGGRSERFDGRPVGDVDPVPLASPPIVVVPVREVPETAAPPSIETCSQSDDTVSPLSADTVSAPAPHEMLSGLPFMALILSGPDPPSMLFAPAPALTVVGRLVALRSASSSPSPRFTTRCESPLDAHLTLLSSVVQLPGPSTAVLTTEIPVSSISY